jgi:hypothetical protein
LYYREKAKRYALPSNFGLTIPVKLQIPNLLKNTVCWLWAMKTKPSGVANTDQTMALDAFRSETVRRLNIASLRTVDDEKRRI